ncbi:unnamed protein product, partial [Schistosoma mattheei]
DFSSEWFHEHYNTTTTTTTTTNNNNNNNNNGFNQCYVFNTMRNSRLNIINPQTFMSFSDDINVNVVSSTFQPQLSNHLTFNKPVNKNCQLIFESVMLNLGNGYDNTTGIFTVPVSGVYIFVVVISAQSYEKAGVRLLQNGKVVLLSWCESTFWATVTNQAIIQLNKNDQIWLECRDEAYRLHGHMYSSLSGYLLYPHDI